MPCCKVNMNKSYKCDKAACTCIPTNGKSCICVCEINGVFTKCDDCKCTSDYQCEKGDAQCMCVATDGDKCICVSSDDRGNIKTLDCCMAGSSRCKGARSCCKAEKNVSEIKFSGRNGSKSCVCLPTNGKPCICVCKNENGDIVLCNDCKCYTENKCSTTCINITKQCLCCENCSNFEAKKSEVSKSCCKKEESESSERICCGVYCQCNNATKNCCFTSEPSCRCDMNVHKSCEQKLRNLCIFASRNARVRDCCNDSKPGRNICCVPEKTVCKGSCTVKSLSCLRLS